MTVNVEPSHLRAPRRRLESRTAPRIFTVPEKGFVRSWTHWSKPDPMATLVCGPQVLGAVKVLSCPLPLAQANCEVPLQLVLYSLEMISFTVEEAATASRFPELDSQARATWR